MSRKLRPYLLLEVIIAFALVALCALPLMRTHYAVAIQEMTTLHDLEAELEAQKAFVEVREKLYEEISWSDLTAGETAPKIVSGEESGKGKEYTYEISVDHQKKKSDRADYRLYTVAIKLNKATYKYTLYAERLREGARQS